jgi:hypothetical protein
VTVFQDQAWFGLAATAVVQLVVTLEVLLVCTLHWFDMSHCNDFFLQGPFFSKHSLDRKLVQHLLELGLLP